MYKIALVWQKVGYKLKSLVQTLGRYAMAVLPSRKQFVDTGKNMVAKNLRIQRTLPIDENEIWGKPGRQKRAKQHLHETEEFSEQVTYGKKEAEVKGQKIEQERHEERREQQQGKCEEERKGIELQSQGNWF